MKAGNDKADDRTLLEKCNDDIVPMHDGFLTHVSNWILDFMFGNSTQKLNLNLSASLPKVLPKHEYGRD